MTTYIRFCNKADYNNVYLVTIGRMVESGEYIAPSTSDMLEDVKIITFESAQHYFLAVSDGGQVYSWGENTGGTCQVCTACVSIITEIIS